jgi:CBS domain-containing protein
VVLGQSRGCADFSPRTDHFVQIEIQLGRDIAVGRNLGMLTAESIMTTNVVTITPDMAIKDAIELLLRLQISGLPVVDQQGRLVGVITEFAVLAMVYDQEVQCQSVGQHMTREVFTVEASDPISRIADLCIVHRVRRLPVMRDGKLVGLIARRDVLKALYENSTQACCA